MDIKILSGIDVSDYMKLRHLAGFEEYSHNRSLAVLAGSTVIRAVDAGNTVAMARVMTDGEAVAFICDVAVMPEYRGKGVGTMLMRAVIDRLRSGSKEGHMHIYLMSVKGKEPFYEKLGFIKRPSGNYGAGMFLEL